MKSKKRVAKEIKAKKHSVKKRLLFGIWFSLVSFGVLVLGTAIFLGSLALNGNEKSLNRNDLVAATFIAAFVLVFVLLLVARLIKNKKFVLVRWTRKSLRILAPLVFVPLIITLLALFGMDNWESSTNTALSQEVSNAVAGNENYFDGLTFENTKLLEATNRERGGANINPLTLNDKLSASAQKKCEDMVTKDYWSHNDPAGIEPWHFLQEAGYSYSEAGENLAYGYITEQQVITGWMNSPSHKDNLLASRFTEVGFGVCKSEDYVKTGRQLIVVQHLAKPGTTSSGGSSIAPKPYVPFKCTKTPIPYQTVYKEVNYLYVGETDSYGGYDGYIETCTAGSDGYKPPDYRSEPIDKTVLVGTKPKPETEPAP